MLQVAKRTGALVCFLLTAMPSYGQAVTTTVKTGTYPIAAAVNPVTNRIYVANFNSNDVTVINGATNLTTTVAVGQSPAAVAVNPVTDKIYVANQGGTCTVIDGATNGTASIPAGNAPMAIAVNPVTNKIYVANSRGNSVTVIDGTTNAYATVGVGTFPVSVDINTVTNKIYVANKASNNLTVMDGATNAVSTINVGANPVAVGTDPVTNRVYVANEGSNDVTVIDGATNAALVVPAGGAPSALAVNPVTNKIYVANAGSNTITVIDGETNATSTVNSDFDPVALAVNPVTNETYVANQSGTAAGGNVTIIDGAVNIASSLTAGSAFKAVAINSVTNKAYLPDSGENSVVVVDGTIDAYTAVTSEHSLGRSSGSRLEQRGSVASGTSTDPSNTTAAVSTPNVTESVVPEPSTTITVSNSGLLSGCTVSASNTVQNCSGVPAGWSLVRAEGFESSLRGGEILSGRTSVTSAIHHSGTHAIGGTYTGDGQVIALYLQQWVIPAYTDLYVSYWNYFGPGAFLGTDLFLEDIYDSGDIGTANEVYGYDSEAVPPYSSCSSMVAVEMTKYPKLGVYSYHWRDARTFCANSGKWQQIEIWYHPNTVSAGGVPNNNGFLKLYVNGQLQQQSQPSGSGPCTGNFQPPPAGSCNGNFAGVWASGGRVPTFQSAGVTEMEIGGVITAFCNSAETTRDLNFGVQCPSNGTHKFARYIDDVVVMKK